MRGALSSSYLYRPCSCVVPPYLFRLAFYSVPPVLMCHRFHPSRLVISTGGTILRFLSHVVGRSLSSPSHIGFVRACVVSDENRPRSNESETRDRCRLVRTPGLSYMPAGCSRQSILPSAPPSALGAGDYLRAAGEEELAGGGRAKNEEKKRACFPYSFSHSLCLSRLP